MALTEDIQVVLASASPRRRALLEGIGLRVCVLPAHLAESPAPRESPQELVQRLAVAKAQAIASRLRAEHNGHPPVLGSDTEVVLEARVFGKPADREDAIGMLASLSGRVHDVLTAVAVVTEAHVQVALSHSRVAFREIRREEAEAYWATGEPRDKAGAYAIQGIGGTFVARLEGSYSGVMGLPVAETELLLRDAGVDVWRHRRESR